MTEDSQLNLHSHHAEPDDSKVTDDLRQLRAQAVTFRKS